MTSGPVTLPLLLSMPSMVKLLLRGRCPPTDGPVPSPTAPLEPTPALSSDRLMIPLVPESGRSDIEVLVNDVCTEAVVVSMVAAEAETSTVSTLVPTSSLILVVAVLLRAMVTARICVLVNPDALTVIV